MLKASQRKIKSGPSRRQIRPKIFIAAIAGIIVLIVVASSFAAYARQSIGTTKIVLGRGTPNAQEYQLETVTTSAAQAKGLSYRSSLARNTGMLFQYEASEQHCIWMKDMHFDLDIVWLDASKRVTSIVPNLNPSTYPQAYCAESQYVIELNAGDAAARGLRVGQIVQF